MTLLFQTSTLSDLGVNIGPNGNFPQTGIENNYQVVNNLSWLKGNHSFKFGGDFRQGYLAADVYTESSG